MNRNALKINKKLKKNIAEINVQRLLKIINLSHGARILDVGCGGGEFLKILSEKLKNPYCYGIEPFPIYDFVYDKNKIIKAYAENIPFKSNTFDLVTCIDVLEHVNNVPQVLNEMLRVSKKYIYIKFPNYLYPYETHFKIPYLPFMPKKLAKLWLKIFGFKNKEIEFIEHINYVSKFSIYKLLHTRKDIYAIIDLQIAKKKKIFFNSIDILTNNKCELLIIKQ